MSVLRDFDIAFYKADRVRQTPSTSTLAAALEIYFQRCHRQPIWCFNPDEIRDYASVADEVALAVLALTSHFEPEKNAFRQYSSNARHLIMQQLAQGSARLSTIEALCLLSQSYFMAGELSVGRYHVALGLQLCQMASMDVAPGYLTNSMIDQRKKRVFWSLQILAQHHGQRTDTLSMIKPPWDQNETSDTGRPPGQILETAPSMPGAYGNDTDPKNEDVWNFLVRVACIWSRLRLFVSDCMTGRVQKPWRRDSIYAEITAESMALECRVPLMHRYQNAKFYQRERAEVENNGQYWKPWLSMQVGYHATMALSNHPFLYVAASQHNKHLAVLNTFWTRSSQLALLHATWTVRIAEMILDRELLLSDPIFAQSAAIAATIHLYYCSASDVRLKQKSMTDLGKCRRFLDGFKPCSPLSVALSDRLETLLQATLGTFAPGDEGLPPTPISLNARLMWDVLELACSKSGVSGPVTGLLHWSLAPVEPPRTTAAAADEVVFEVGCAVSPEVNVDTSDAGQSAPMLSVATAEACPPPRQPNVEAPGAVQIVASDAPAGTSPGNVWLWGGQARNMTSIGFDLQAETIGGLENSAWWDFGDL